MTKKSLLLIACLCLGSLNSGLAQAPAVTTFERLVAHLSKEDVRTLKANRDPEATRKLANALGKPLEKLEGQKITLEFMSGEIYPSPFNKDLTLISSDKSCEVKAQGVPMTVKILTSVDPSLSKQLKECHERRKIFVTGTVTSISLYAGQSLATSKTMGTETLGVSLSLQAENLGRAK